MSAAQQDGPVRWGATDGSPARGSVSRPPSSAGSEPKQAEPDAVEPAATPLTSLDSLLGGALEGASTCAVDGTCD